VKIVEAAELVSLHPLVEKRAQIGAPQLARDVADKHKLLPRRIHFSKYGPHSYPNKTTEICRGEFFFFVPVGAR
jgi:hypothetical protein